jgi:regulator of cell morphogenesis and NO signaling
MYSIENSPVGDIVREYPSSAQVFAAHGIDFCCGGKVPLTEVCEKKGINREQLIREILKNQNSGMSEVPRFNHWPEAFMCDYIENNHHEYVKSMIPVIQKWIHKVAKVHGDWKPENIRIASAFDKLASEMMSHMMKEEKQAFPLIRKIKTLSGSEKEEALAQLRQLIDEMEEEHEGAGDLMRVIRELSHDFVPPEEACNTYRAAYEALSDFEKDLHQHVHLENNILFPNMLKMQKGIEEAG